MLYHLGMGMRGHGPLSPVLLQEFVTTATMPSFLTYTRNDTVAMYRDVTGNWQKGVANTPFFHHDINGTPLGLWIEPARTNKCTNINWQMAALTNVTAGGNASGSVAIGTHPVYGFPTIMIDNTLGGSGTKYANIGGTFDNTNPHSMSVQYYVETGNGANAFINDSGGVGSVLGSASVTAGQNGELKSENFTPSHTSRTMRINAGFNSKIHFWLNSLEEAAYCTNPIYVNGAAASRVQTRIYTTSPAADLGTYFDVNKGTLGVIAYVPKVTNIDMLPAIFSDGSTNNTLGLRLYTDGFVRPAMAAGGVAQSAQSVNRIIAGRDFPMAVTWGGGNTKTVAGAGRTRRETGQTLPTSVTRLDIGSRYNGNQGFFGGIKKLVFANDRLPNTKLGALLMPSGSRGILTMGQSLADNLRRSDVDQNNNGEIAFLAQLDTTWSATAGKNWLVHGATGGAGVLYKNTTGGAWYYDDVNILYGDAWTTCEDAMNFFLGGGGTIEGILFDGAQQDAGSVALTGQDYTDVYNGIKNIVTKVRGMVGSTIPLVIMPTTGRTDTGLEERYQYLRELQWAYSASETASYRGPETFDLPKGDTVHLSAAGYTTSGSRSSRKILAVLGAGITGVDGAVITNASRSGTSVTVTLAHDAGTDFTPTTGIQGFKYFDGGGSEVTISAAVRTNATTITLTLVSGVAGTLYYGYGWLYGVTQANLVQGNAATPMPLRAAKISVS